MANPYQQQVFQRKLVYLGLVVALLAVSWGCRRYMVEEQARSLQLLEETRGDVEVVGAAARTALSGLRGLATCGLWMQAIDQQEKNQWNRLERTVKQLTRLQPHLITPWIFQAWNLSFNVARDVDRPVDKYFYIARGVQLLARGERQNRFQPNMRNDIGFFMQQKICMADETNTFRSFWQLSCIRPNERDPDAFRRADGSIDREKLEQFCRAHPQLARRLHSPPLPYNLHREYLKFRCNTAEELLRFLDEARYVPTLFVTRLEDEEAWRLGKPLENPADRFPVMPPRRGGKFNPLDPADEDLIAQHVPDEFDAFTAARCWYGYAQECLPPVGDLPGSVGPITDRARQRRPRFMAISLFRSRPALAQCSIAERLQYEGWFDDEPFVITGWFQPPGEPDRPVPVGESRKWSEDAWTVADRMWREFGLRNHLDFPDDAQRNNMEFKAEQFRKEFGLKPDDPLPAIKRDLLDERQRDLADAFEFMRLYYLERGITNYPNFIMRTAVEMQPRTIKARKLFYQAEQLHVVKQDLIRALEKYEYPDAFLAWRQILEDNPPFRAADRTQEDSFEIELKYLRLYRRQHEGKLAPDLAMLAGLGQSMAAAPAGADWTVLGLFAHSQVQPNLTVVGPLDKDSRGKPFFSETSRNAVLIRLGLKSPPEPSP